MNTELKNIDNRRRLIIYYAAYTLAFAVLFFLCFQIHLLINDKSLLNYVDSFNMHYNSYIEAGRLFRAFFKSGIQQWEPNIGYGTDIFDCMGGYFIDPLYLVTLWIPERFSEPVFNAIVVFRLYLAGISFSILSLKRGNQYYSTFCGAIVYTFSACAYIGLNQSSFIMPMYVLPVLIMGADELYEKKKPTLYVLMLAYFALSSFYFVYMFAIMLVCYCLLKWILTDKDKRTFKDLIKKVISFLLYSVWSAFIAAFALVPAALIMRNMGRLGLRRYVPALYDFTYYKNFYQGYITSYNMLERDGMIGISAVAFLSLIVLFMISRKELRRLKIEIILMTLGLLIPFVGYIFNGRNYPANRWSFFYILVLAYMTTVILPEIRDLSKNRKLAVILVTVLYVFLGLTVFDAGISGFAVIGAFALVLGVAMMFSHKCPKKTYQYICVAITCVSVILPAYFKYSNTTSLSMMYLVPSGKGYQLLTEENGMVLLNELEVKDGTRYNHSKTVKQYRNTSMLTGKSGVNFYYNMYNDYVDRFHQSIGLNTNPCNFNYDGLDNRSELMALMGVNYYLINDDTLMLPVGYSTDNGKSYQQYKLLTSEYKNSLFTLFDQNISEEEFNNLSPVEKQEVLMKACVTDIAGNSGDAVTKGLEGNELSYTVTCDDGNEISDGVIKVAKEKTGFVMTFDEQCDAEIYFSIQNLDKNEINPINYYVRASGRYNGENVPELSNYLIGATYANHMYGGKHDWMLNAGRTTSPVNQLYITFDAPGNYSFECMKLYKRDVKSIESNIAGLDHGVTDLVLATDKVSFNSTTGSKKYLLMTIPYSDGWTAYDNGEKAVILHGDIGFMALELTPGEHHIELKYDRHGAKAGALISLVSLAGFIAYSVVTRKKHVGVKVR